MKILLIGNPNVGKSVIFNRLTGASVLASNYPGTTIEFTRGYLPIEGEKAEVIDVPGTYSIINPTSPAEDVAVKMLDELEDAVVVNVVNSTNLERSLNLTLQLVEKKVPMVVALNYWDETKHIGIEVDRDKLEELLGVPCVPTTATTGVGIKELAEKLKKASVSPYNVEPGERWHDVGRIVEQVQNVEHRHHTFLEHLGDLSVKAFPGIPIALFMLAAMFWGIRYIGESIVELFEKFVFDEGFYGVLMTQLSGVLGPDTFWHRLLLGDLIDGEISFGESMGLLTTGVQVPIGAVFPYVLAFYFVLSFLEDCGYLPRLAVLMDTLMHRLGLHGMSIIPMLLGMGCNVPGVMAARIMESKRQRFIAVLLMVICVPCMAQTSIIIALCYSEGYPNAIFVIFGTLFVVWVILGMIFKRIIHGESPPILIDIPPYRLPYIPGLFKKLYLRMKWFFKEAIPFVLLGVLIVNLMYIFGVMEFLGNITGPVISGMMGLPEDAVGGIIVGFLRKDVVVGMLKPLELSFAQVVVASVLLTMYFPCVATFAVMLKEFGIRGMAKAAGIMIVVSIAVGSLLNLILTSLGF